MESQMIGAYNLHNIESGTSHIGFFNKVIYLQLYVYTGKAGLMYDKNR
jgi:hypothetical protein